MCEPLTEPNRMESFRTTGIPLPSENFWLKISTVRSLGSVSTQVAWLVASTLHPTSKMLPHNTNTCWAFPPSPSRFDGSKPTWFGEM